MGGHDGARECGAAFNEANTAAAPRNCRRIAVHPRVPVGYLAPVPPRHAALALLAAALVAGAAIGKTSIPLEVVVKTVANRMFDAGYHVEPLDEGIVWAYRLGRAMADACCGASLSLAGAVLQSLLRNPLADPYVLDISAGASTGAVAVTLLGSGAGFLTVPAGAFAGVLIAFGLVSMLALRAGSGSNGIMFWLLGNLSGIRWVDVSLAFPVAAARALLMMSVCFNHSC